MKPLVAAVAVLISLAVGAPLQAQTPEIDADAVRARAEEGVAAALETVEGGALYLTRLGFETHRAEFLDAADCEHVAGIMNQAEPLVNWRCSTSVPDIVLYESET